MDFYVSDTGNWTAEIVGFKPDDFGIGDRLRNYGKALNQITSKLFRKAENIDPGEHGQIVMSSIIYQDSTVEVRLDEEIINSSEEFAWLDECIDHMKEAARL